MIKGNKTVYMFVTLIFALLYCHCAEAQVGVLMSKGDSLYRNYRFDEALEFYDMALAEVENGQYVDSVLFDAASHKLILAENGISMSGAVRKPKVLGKRLFSLDEFYLFYPLENKGWRKLPNQLDSDASDPLVRALYAPDWNNVHYFSAKDENGLRDIYTTELQDTVWALPQKVDRISSDSFNEIYPMLSSDGKTLYFASDSLAGLGGYDIYYSVWDESEGCWSVPQNMGLPFSSPADDFLYVDSEDERYSLFASTRDCPKDSVWVYSVEYEREPVLVSVNDPDELHALSRLDPSERKTGAVKTDLSSDDVTSVYMARMGNCRALKDSIASVYSYLDELRTELAFSNDESERYELSSKILDLEQTVPYLQRELEEAKAELEKAEHEFLKKGIFINPDEAVTDRENEVVEEYEFTRRSCGDSLRINLAVPQVKFDYSFRILDEAVFAEDQSLPSGIVYQIQLLGTPEKASLEDLKGLSPIYEHQSPSGMYIYRVGRFFTHEDASGYIDVVHELGFTNASLRAFEDGKEIPVAKARTVQERLKGGFSLFEIQIVPDSGELNQSVIEALVAAAVGKDIIRTESEDGTQIFTVGPFDVKADADALVETISGMMSGSIVCEPVNN